MLPTDSQTTFVKILETDSLTDIAFIKSVLEEEEIEYFMQGENMKFIDTFLGPMVLMVAENDVKKVVELLEPLNLAYTRINFGKQ